MPLPSPPRWPTVGAPTPAERTAPPPRNRPPAPPRAPPRAPPAEVQRRIAFRRQTPQMSLALGERAALRAAASTGYAPHSLRVRGGPRVPVCECGAGSLSPPLPARPEDGRAASEGEDGSPLLRPEPPDVRRDAMSMWYCVRPSVLFVRYPIDPRRRRQGDGLCLVGN